MSFLHQLEIQASAARSRANQHERREIRRLDKHTLPSVRLDYTTQSRGNIRVIPDHQNAMLA